MATQDYFWLAASIVVLGVVATLFVRKRMKLRRARTWPTTTGRSDATTVRLEQRGNNQSIYAAEVHYSYAVKGVAYTGKLRRTFMRKTSADKWIANYPKDRELTVRYDQNKVRDSVVFEKEQIGVGAA